MKKKLLLLAIIMIITGRWGNAQDIPAKLDSLFNYQYTSQQLIGNVLVAENGKVLYQKSFGYADIPNKILNNDQSIFEIGSISKTLTSTAILQLVQKKKIGLNDPYKKYFPGFPYPDITIRNILSHTSGLPRDGSDVFDTLRKIQPEKVFNYHDILPTLEKYHKPLIFKPGDKWAYSNVGYNLLAVLIEKVTNLTFNVYMKKNIFIPAGMTDTYVKTLSDPENRHLVKGYFYDKRYQTELKEADPNWEKGYSLFVGGGYVFSTTPDMLKFDQALYNNKLVPATLLAEAFKPTILNNGQQAIAEGGGASKLSYGLGWFILNDTTAGRVVLHSGYNPGVWTVFFRNISKKQSVIILSNGEIGRNFERGLNAMNLLNHKPLIANKRSMAEIYAKTLYELGPDAAITRLIQIKSDTANFFYAEGQMNYLANELFDNGFKDKGLETSKIAVLMSPNAIWLYKVYGDILLKAGKKQDAIKMYEKTLALTPDDKGAKEALIKLREKEH